MEVVKSIVNAVMEFGIVDTIVATGCTILMLVKVMRGEI